MKDLRAIMVAVNYADLLAVTLPANRHHFSEVMVVTDKPSSEKVIPLAQANGASVCITNRFYENGAAFNKWAALEYALDLFGREGWLCVMDADVIWPYVAPLDPKIGELWSPLRRMAPWPISSPSIDPSRAEALWSLYSIHRNVGEWAGYSQVFHADDPALGPAPWHEVDWAHAGGADSLFQRKWPAELKRRPLWECLHLGNPGANWYGRATPLADGTVLEGSQERMDAVTAIWERRRAIRQAGGTEGEAFRPERISPSEASTDPSAGPDSLATGRSRDERG